MMNFNDFFFFLFCLYILIDDDNRRKTFVFFLVRLNFHYLYRCIYDMMWYFFSHKTTAINEIKMYFWLQRHDRLVIGLYIIVNHYHYHYHHQWANRTNKLVSCVLWESYYIRKEKHQEHWTINNRICKMLMIICSNKVYI